MTILNLIFLYFLTIIISYLFGSFPSGYILSKYFNKIDITKQGSGNIGATNVLRSGSKSLAILTLLIDALKGAIPVILFSFNSYLMALASLFSFLGHNFPVWLKFKGGKGVATYLGVILALSYKFFLIFGITWLVLSFLFRYASLSSIISSLIVFVYSYFFINNFSLILFIFFVIIVYTHRENIVRLKNSEESKIKL